MQFSGRKIVSFKVQLQRIFYKLYSKTFIIDDYEKKKKKTLLRKTPKS